MQRGSMLVNWSLEIFFLPGAMQSKVSLVKARTNESMWAIDYMYLSPILLWT